MKDAIANEEEDFAAFDAAVPPIAARHAHDELQDTPILDKGFYVMMGNNHLIFEQLAAGQTELLDAAVSWLLNATGGYAAKLVNPGGVEIWKNGGDGILWSGRTRRTVRRDTSSDPA